MISLVFGALASLLLAVALAQLLSLVSPIFAAAWLPLAVMLFIGGLMLPTDDRLSGR